MKTSREDLIVVALKLFLQKGYAQTSMVDLARAGGVSKGAFHHYFPRKSDLRDACVAHFFGDFLTDGDSDSDVTSLAGLAHATAQRYAKALIRLRQNAIPLPAFQAFLWDQLRDNTRPFFDFQVATEQRLSQLLQAEHPQLQPARAARRARHLLALIEGTGSLLSITPDPQAEHIEAAFHDAVEDFLADLSPGASSC